MEQQKCNTCGIVKELNMFPVSLRKDNAALKSGSTINKHNDQRRSVIYRKECKSCCAVLAKEFRKRYKEKTGCSDYRGSGKTNQYPKEDRALISAIRRRLSQAKGNIKRKDGLFNLTEEYMYNLFKKQKGCCALSNVPMEINGNTNLRLSIDKIEHTEGYVEGNVQWTIFAVNRAKGDLTNDDFIKLCKLVIERATTIETTP